jgi:hypothetical protein
VLVEHSVRSTLNALATWPDTLVPEELWGVDDALATVLGLR